VHGDDRGLVETKMGCGSQYKMFASVEGRYDETRPIEGCDTSVVPVLGGANGEMNARDYKQLISDGFLLTWDHPLPPRKFARQIIFYLDFPYHINRASTNYTSAPFLIRAITSFTAEERWQITLASHFFQFFHEMSMIIEVITTFSFLFTRATFVHHPSTKGLLAPKSHRGIIDTTTREYLLPTLFV
jgi:hypothetical protein